MVSKFEKITLFSNQEIIAGEKQIDKKNKSAMYLSLFPKIFHYSTNEQSKTFNHQSNFIYKSAAATYAFIYSQISSPVEAGIIQWRKALGARYKPNVRKASFKRESYALRNSDNAISDLAETINITPEITMPEGNRDGKILLQNSHTAKTIIIKNTHKEEQQKKIEFLMQEIHRLHLKIITITNKLTELNQEETALQEIKKKLVSEITEFATQFSKLPEKNIEPKNAYITPSQQTKYLINMEEKLKNKARVLANKINNKLKTLDLEKILKNQRPALEEINTALYTIKTEISKNNKALKNMSIVLSLLSDNLHKLFITKKSKAKDEFNQPQGTTTTSISNNITNNVVFMPNRIKK